ncbi:MAG: hypothetical protein ACD_40C00059G0002 [uncultured bacterium]|nr:MAG: hypothetical protein ACD_40C00059G0002 [uncultured bacterium]
MGEYMGEMPHQGFPGRELQPVRITTIKPQPPHHGWAAHIQSISPPIFSLDIGYDLHFLDESLLLAELTLYNGLVKE